MLPDITSFPVNWTDGMKISSRDFIAMENAFADDLRDARAAGLHGYAYGLLPTNQPEVDNYPKLVYDYARELLVLRECRALTPGGHRIEITEANHERRKYPAQLPAVAVAAQEPGRFDIYLRLDPAERVGAGAFAANNPPRHQAVAPRYELSKRRADGTYVEQENFLKISEIEVREGRVEVLSATGRYIPPCLTMHACWPLRRIHEAGEERLKGLVQHHANLVNRLGVDGRSDAAGEAAGLVEKIVMPLVASLNHYRYVLPAQPPVCTAVYCKDYVQTVRFWLDRPFRTDVINRFKPELLEAMALLEKTEPRHGAMRPLFDQVMQVLDGLDQFLAELSRYQYDKREFDTYDYNRLAPAGARAVPAPPPAEPAPPRPAPAPAPPDVKRPERIY